MPYVPIQLSANLPTPHYWNYVAWNNGYLNSSVIFLTLILIPFNCDKFFLAVFTMQIWQLEILTGVLYSVKISNCEVGYKTATSSTFPHFVSIVAFVSRWVIKLLINGLLYYLMWKSRNLLLLLLFWASRIIRENMKSIRILLWN